MNLNDEQPKKTWFTVTNDMSLVAWMLFLTAIVVPVAIIVNFNMYFNRFNIEMAEHWIGYKPPATANAVSLSAADLERTYNKIAHSMNHITARVTGGIVVNGVPQQVAGSGVVIADQYVITNYHVVATASDIQVTVYTPAKTEATYFASVLMTDQTNDLALLKVETTTVLPSASLGNSDAINPGDIVFAMGNAFGKGNVFTTGVVCDRNQSFAVNGRSYRDLIRTESYTYPGSSGGPLANINGEIIGINTAVYNPNGQFTGISFAMPINRALNLLQNSGVPAFDAPGGAMAVAFPNDRFLLQAA